MGREGFGRAAASAASGWARANYAALHDMGGGIVWLTGAPRNGLRWQGPLDEALELLRPLPDDAGLVETSVPFCGSGAFDPAKPMVAVCTTHSAYHELFGTTPQFTTPYAPDEAPGPRSASSGCGRSLLQPANRGTVIREGRGTFEGRLRIDTTKLSNGLHKLVMIAHARHINGRRPDGTNSGIEVLPFWVRN